MDKVIDVDVKKLDEILRDPVAELVLRRMLIGFKGTAEQLAKNVKLDQIKYGEPIKAILEKLVKSKLTTKRSYAYQDTVYSSVPNMIKKQVFVDGRLRKLKETGFIELQTRLT